MPGPGSPAREPPRHARRRHLGLGTLAEADLLLHDAFVANAGRLGDKVALVTDSGRHTYGDIDRLSARLAATLQRRGLRRGDRVALFLPNGPEMVAAVYGVLRAGGAFMPLNPQTKQTKLAYVLRDARPAAVVTAQELSRVFRAAREGCDSVTTAVVAGLEGAAGEGEISFAEATADSGGPPRETGAIDMDLAAIIYTSGSTGEPKGVMLTHLNMVSASRSIQQYLGLREDDVILCALPLSFDYGLYQVLMAFNLGARVALEMSFTYLAKVLGTMQRERVTVLPGVPTLFAMLAGLEGLGRYDLSSLRAITNTAAALSETRIRELRGLFPKAQLFSMYGLTECKRVTYLPPAELDRRPTSVGKGMPNEEVYLVDEEGRELPPGSTGELVVRGSNVMRGYWNKPEESARRLRPGRYPGEVVLHTGDLFRTDEEGFLYFVARKDDIIKSRGEKVSPREVEEAIHRMAGVAEVAVVGVPDPLLGEAVKAFVVLRAGVSCTERDVVKHCLAHLESFMAPRYVEFVPSLPLTGTGKVSKSDLRKARGSEGP